MVVNMVNKNHNLITLRYDKGTIVIEGGRIPHSEYDDRTGNYRALGMYYGSIAEWCRSYPEPVTDTVPRIGPMKEIAKTLPLRSYQKKSVDIWVMNDYRGVVVLPTAAGKTFVGMEAILRVQKPALIIVPTIDLVEQWSRRIEENLEVAVGRYGGGDRTVEAITVSTYDSALIHASDLGNRFMLLIVDEVHHLPSSSFRQIAEMYIAPYRLGLTATYERADMMHEDLEYLMGGKIVEMGFEELNEYLADYRVQKIFVELSPEEQKEYDESRDTFLRYLKRYHMRINTPWEFETFIRKSWNPEGREALKAWRKARDISFNPAAKLDMVKNIVATHKGEKIIIFTENNDMAYVVSETILVPCITHQTDKSERNEILKNFRNSTYKIIVTSRVLDEGVDVPDASIGIVLSGSGSNRQFRQRLGRILRPGINKEAILYEIISRATSEISTSKRRGKGVPKKSADS